MPSFPTAVITHAPVDPADPTQRSIVVTVDRAGFWVVRLWLTKSSTPTDDVPATGFSQDFVTDEFGVLTHTVNNSTREAFYAQAAVIGPAFSGSGAGLPYLLVGTSADVITEQAAFEAWGDALNVGQKIYSPGEGTVLALDIAPAPTISTIIIAVPEAIRELNSVVQQSTGLEVSPSWVNSPDNVQLEYQGATLNVYQLKPFIPWSLPDRFTITL